MAKHTIIKEELRHDDEKTIQEFLEIGGFSEAQKKLVKDLFEKKQIQARDYQGRDDEGFYYSASLGLAPFIDGVNRRIEQCMQKKRKQERKHLVQLMGRETGTLPLIKYTIYHFDKLASIALIDRVYVFKKETVLNTTNNKKAHRDW